MEQAPSLADAAAHPEAVNPDDHIKPAAGAEALKSGPSLGAPVLQEQWRRTVCSFAAHGVLLATILSVLINLFAPSWAPVPDAWAVSIVSTVVLAIGTLNLVIALWVTEGIEQNLTAPLLMAPLTPGTPHHLARSVLLCLGIILIPVTTLVNVVFLWYWAAFDQRTPDPANPLDHMIMTKLLISNSKACYLINMTTLSVWIAVCTIVQFLVIQQQMEQDAPILGVTQFCAVHKWWRRSLRSATMTCCLLALVCAFGFHIAGIWITDIRPDIVRLTALQRLPAVALGGISILFVLQLTEHLAY
jgi:hypothetical protein